MCVYIHTHIYLGVSILHHSLLLVILNFPIPFVLQYAGGLEGVMQTSHLWSQFNGYIYSQHLCADVDVFKRKCL